MWHLSFILHHNAHIYIISEESSQKLISGVKHIFIRSGNCWVGRFCWKPRWFLKRPGVIPDAKGEEDTVFPPFGKDQDEDMNHEYFTHHELYEPELAIVPGWGSISMYPSRYVLYMCIYLALSLSLSRYTYIMVSCHTFRLLHALVHIFATSTRWTRFTAMKFIWSAKILLPTQKNQEGKNFHPNKNPLSGSESKKKGCTARCLILPIHRHPPTWAGWTRLEAWSPLDPWQWHRW